jgi:hypothetical protein
MIEESKFEVSDTTGDAKRTAARLQKNLIHVEVPQIGRGF